MSRNKPSLPKGTRDFGLETSAKRAYIIDTIKRNFIKYGFSQLETPAMENLSVLTGKYGDEGDQLLFKILNSGDFLSKVEEKDMSAGSRYLTPKISEKGLRYDLTVPFARFVVMNQHEISFPFKRFQIQPVWRADRPQRGRYREFYQCDADIIGSRSVWNEVELVLLIKNVLSDLGLENDCMIKVNHREILFTLARYVGLEGQELSFCSEMDKLDKIGIEAVSNNVVGIGADRAKILEIKEWLQDTDNDVLQKIGAVDSTDTTCTGIKEITDFFKTLNSLQSESDAQGVKVEPDISLARGLSYYTGLIYEVISLSVNVGSICGGGRYDNLTGAFGLEGVSGIGISFGLDRIYDVMEELKLFPEKVGQSVDILIVHFNESNMAHGQKMVMKMREKGIRAELYPETVKIKKQFNYADKINVPYVLIIGDEEMNSDQYALKDMKIGTQQNLSFDQIIKLIQG